MATGGQRWVARLIKAAQTGVPLDLGEIQGKREWTEVSHVWPRNATIPANALRQALLTPGLVADPRGLTAVGARVSGILDLRYAEVSFALGLVDCRFDQTPVVTSAHFSALKLTGSSLPGLLADELCVDSDLELDSISSTGEVRGLGANVRGQLNCIGASLTGTEGDALVFDACTIGGGAFFRGLRSIGDVRALGGNIAGDFDLTGATLSNPGGDALSLDRSTVGGAAFLNKITTTGTIRGLGVTIRGRLDLGEATLTGTEGLAIDLHGCTIVGPVAMGQLVAHGAVHIRDSTISGMIDLSRATLVSEGGPALNLDNSTVVGGAFLTKISADGGIRAVGAVFKSQLHLKEAVLSNPAGEALTLDGCTISGGAFFSKLAASGGVRALGATFSRTLDLSGAVIATEGRDALSLDGSTVEGGVFLADLETTGTVRAIGATITGQLDLSGARCGDLVLQQARLSSLDLSRLNTSLTVDLTSARIEDLVLGAETVSGQAPRLRGANGLQILRVHGLLHGRHKEVMRWLETIGTPERAFSPQPWNMFADLFERDGFPQGARKLRFESARRTTRNAPWWTRVPRWCHHLAVGYGYYPLAAAVWLLLIAGFGAWLAATEPGSFVPADLSAAYGDTFPADLSAGAKDSAALTAGYPHFQALAQGVGVAIPASALAVNRAWEPVSGSVVSYAFSGLHIMAWILSVLFLAGLAGVLRKR